jgi:hypothetical protein
VETLMSTQLTRAIFEQNLNSRFWLRDGDGERKPLDLIELKDGRSSPPYEQFALLFRGDKSKIHPQSIYPVEHDAIGGFDLFLVPVDRNDQGTFYQAVFNRLADRD